MKCTRVGYFRMQTLKGIECKWSHCTVTILYVQTEGRAPPSPTLSLSGLSGRGVACLSRASLCAPAGEGRWRDGAWTHFTHIMFSERTRGWAPENSMLLRDTETPRPTPPCRLPTNWQNVVLCFLFWIFISFFSFLYFIVLYGKARILIFPLLNRQS